MTLFEKIKNIYPILVNSDFDPRDGTIFLKNDSDGRGDYISKWEHPTLPRPTQEQLDSVEE